MSGIVQGFKGSGIPFHGPGTDGKEVQASAMERSVIIPKKDGFSFDGDETSPGTEPHQGLVDIAADNFPPPVGRGQPSPGASPDPRTRKPSRGFPPSATGPERLPAPSGPSVRRIYLSGDGLVIGDYSVAPVIARNAFCDEAIPYSKRRRDIPPPLERGDCFVASLLAMTGPDPPSPWGFTPRFCSSWASWTASSWRRTRAMTTWGWRWKRNVSPRE